MNVCTNIDEALLNNLFNPTSYLFGEPQNLLNRLTRKQALYNTILTAIAHGCNRVNSIAAYAGISIPICGKYLNELQNMGLIKKESPFKSESRKIMQYYIASNFLRF